MDNLFYLPDSGPPRSRCVPWSLWRSWQCPQRRSVWWWRDQSHECWRPSRPAAPPPWWPRARWLRRRSPWPRRFRSALEPGRQQRARWKTHTHTHTHTWKQFSKRFWFFKFFRKFNEGFETNRVSLLKQNPLCFPKKEIKFGMKLEQK